MSDDSASIVLTQHNKTVPSFAKADSLTFWNIRSALKTNNKPATHLSRIVQSSWDPYARGIAVIAMSTLADNDTCLYAIVHSLLDVAASTSIMPAHESLIKILEHRTRPVILKPMLLDLQRLVNGTNLFAYWDVLKLISMAKPTEQEFNEIFAQEPARRLLYSHLAATSFYPRTIALKLVNIVNPKFASLSEAEQKKYLNIR